MDGRRFSDLRSSEKLRMIELPKRTIQKAIYFHEDDYCQIEILPLSLWNYCLDEMKKIDDFSESHKADIGWTDIYLRQEKPESLIDFSISVDNFEQSLEKTLRPYSKVSTGYSSYFEECKNCRAWGIDEGSFTIFAEVTTENLINVIWLDFGLLNSKNLPVVIDSLKNLPRNNELMIADWKWSQAAKINDTNSLENYLALHTDLN
jgi:hypothetical protein